MPVTYAVPTDYVSTQSSNSNLPPAWVLFPGRLARKLIDLQTVLSAQDGYFDDDVMDFAGMMTDTARWGEVSGIGAEQGFTSAGSETSAITASAQTTDYTAISVAEYVLAYTETFRSQILNGNAGRVALTLDQLLLLLPENIEKTYRTLIYASGAAITAATIGSTTLANSADDLYDLTAAFAAATGAQSLGAPLLTIRPAQHSAIVKSFRSEAHLFGTDLVAKMQRVQTGITLEDPYGLGINVKLATEVTSASSVLKGFATSPRTWKRAIANPSNVRIPANSTKFIVPSWGMVVWDRLGGSDTRTSGWNAYFNAGISRKPSTQAFQALFRSVA